MSRLVFLALSSLLVLVYGDNYQSGNLLAYFNGSQPLTQNNEVFQQVYVNIFNNASVLTVAGGGPVVYLINTTIPTNGYYVPYGSQALYGQVQRLNLSVINSSIPASENITGATPALDSDSAAFYLFGIKTVYGISINGSVLKTLPTPALQGAFLGGVYQNLVLIALPATNYCISLNTTSGASTTFNTSQTNGVTDMFARADGIWTFVGPNQAAGSQVTFINATSMSIIPNAQTSAPLYVLTSSHHFQFLSINKVDGMTLYGYVVTGSDGQAPVYTFQPVLSGIEQAMSLDDLHSQNPYYMTGTVTGWGYSPNYALSYGYNPAPYASLPANPGVQYNISNANPTLIPGGSVIPNGNAQYLFTSNNMIVVYFLNCVANCYYPNGYCSNGNTCTCQPGFSSSNYCASSPTHNSPTKPSVVASTSSTPASTTGATNTGQGSVSSAVSFKHGGIFVTVALFFTMF